ncbi:ThuA domain-containing protein [Catalinimonas sp. 4WD22]|uniref:ThuA domain-containing protein n=1 Tax=Catalinimonas locisalis TaxID=3133978 RepID=UPI003101569B
MKYIISIFCLTIFLHLILLRVFSGELQAQNDKLIPVLIVDGFSNHDWKQTTAVTQWILEESGYFEVEVSTIPADSNERMSWLPQFSDYAVVVQNTNNIQDTRVRWPAQAEKALERYVEKGGGLYVLHSANNAFPHWQAYDEMIGLGWRADTVGHALEVKADEQVVRHAPGEGKGTSHGERFNALIQILNRHPINEGYPEAWQTVNTEVYSFPRGPAKNLTILSYAYDSTDTQKMWPVEWLVSYGKGRVYNSSLGHLWTGETYPPAYRCVGYQTTVIRAAEWLANGKVSYPMPPDFPTRDSPRLREAKDFVQTMKEQQ